SEQKLRTIASHMVLNSNEKLYLHQYAEFNVIKNDAEKIFNKILTSKIINKENGRLVFNTGIRYIPEVYRNFEEQKLMLYLMILEKANQVDLFQSTEGDAFHNYLYNDDFQLEHSFGHSYFKQDDDYNLLHFSDFRLFKHLLSNEIL